MLTERQLQQRRAHTLCSIKDCDGLHIPNVPLMRKVIDKIKEDPNSWVQNVWVVAPNRRFEVGEDAGLNKRYDPETDQVVITRQGLTKDEVCGTAFCIAGHATMLSADPLKMVTRVKGIPYYKEETQQGYTPQQRAQHELGLTDVEASSLFHGANSWKEVIGKMKNLAAIAGDQL